MRLHSNIITHSNIMDALKAAKKDGQVDPFVNFEILEERGSRSHTRAFEIQLSWDGDKIKGDGRRFKNTGKSGADSVYAATYDEWGYFISNLFGYDEQAKFGHYKHYDDFLSQTNFQY